MGSIKQFLKDLIKKPVIAIANTVSSSPKKEKVFASLTDLYRQALEEPGEKDSKLVHFDPKDQSIIIFSDQHKGTGNGSDDFKMARPNYLEALSYYYLKDYYYINLGDCEELWENTVSSVVKHNVLELEAEKKFADKNSYCKIIGNHDLFWGNDPFAQLTIKKMYGKELKIYEGILLKLQLKNSVLKIFCTHGHQGDLQSDGNAFSKWFVSYVWGPLQMFLDINTNTPSNNDQLKTLHNQFMYEWSCEQEDVVLITGHTHQPVFQSLTHLERLYLDLEEAQLRNDRSKISSVTAEIPRRRREYDYINHSFRNMKPSYFNTGCCCFDDGTLTGIEIGSGEIRLVKWTNKNGKPTRIIAEAATLESVYGKIANEQNQR